MPYLEVKELELHYSAGSRVGPISFSAETGEFISLLGPSGCGKTTTLRCIAGFARPNSGDIVIDGRSVLNLPPNKRDIGLVFQNYALFPHLTVFENVAFGLRLRRDPAIEARVRSALDLVGLADFSARMPRQLSGGQQQRVALARSIVLEPKLLLLDEPLSNLDAKLRVQMRELLRHLQRQIGVTTIYVTHDQTEALALSDRVAVMNLGQVCQFAAPRDIYDSPATSFVADFIGTSNLLSGQITAWAEGRGRFRTGGLSFGVEHNVRSFVPGQVATVLIRPECIQLAESTAFPGQDIEAFPATVAGLSYVGDYTHVTLRLEGGGMLAASVRSRGAFLPAEGAAIQVLVPSKEIYLLPDGGGA